MTLPSFNAEQSLYRTGRHYRASALASAAGGVRPSDYLPVGSYLNSCVACTSIAIPTPCLAPSSTTTGIPTHPA